MQPESINAASAGYIAGLRKNAPSAKALAQGVLNGDITALSRAITLIESANPNHFEKAAEVIAQCLPHANKSVRIGITGVPGVGKSTFIEAFGKYLTGIGKKVAVLAVDPSSTVSHGSILGDKTRMEELVKDKNAYIRPSASGETLGGVAQKTRESVILCEACGFDTILIETVGVGQSETAVHSMVDFFLLLQIAGAGDELQGIKRGIMEMADLVVINKADGDNTHKANFTKTELNRALHYFPPKASGWQPKAMTCSAVNRIGISETWQQIERYINHAKNNGYFEMCRHKQNTYWFTETIHQLLLNRFYSNSETASHLETVKKAVQNGEISPFAAASIVLKKYFSS
ncbi:methylmalonyl Co-A mutase-associated GTPase MeaB [Flavobacterium sp. ST-119]|uniref:Methylmalonyl Co-A mutase-associated GTPase MeaB n=1 Tax=Flavobacterium rhizosphaerae TaxID=3163298 RepID=A0ABW8YWF7_9FLAO